jgi:hypothetical protein
MNTLSIIDAIANKQYNAAEEGMSSLLQSKVGAALIARKEEVAEAYGDTLGEQSDYDTFFKKAMKKFGIDSPADLKSEEDKKEFFNYVDKNFKGKNEEVNEEEEDDDDDDDDEDEEEELEEDEEVDEDIDRQRQHLGMFDASGNPRMSRQERARLKREKLAIKNQDKRKHGYVPKASAMKKEEHEEVDEDIERAKKHLGMFDASGNPRMSRQERARLKREKLAIQAQDKRKHGYVPKASAMKKP